ncbi:MAG: nuclear transport factor 2 family protein [Thermoplasmata archaeon]
MKESNEQVVREAYAAFSRGDMKHLRSMMREDVIWHEPGKSLISGTYQGPTAVTGLFRKYGELSGGTFRVETIHDVLNSTDHAATVATVRGERNAKSMKDTDTILFRVVDGKLGEAWVFYRDQGAVDLFWS